MLGTTISHYKITEKLGEGGMGVVYKATDTALGRTVALKFISPSASADESMKQRLAREARACAALNHPNITTVYEFVETEEYNFIAIEFVDGKTLDRVLQGEHFQWKEALPLMLQLLDGLDAAHRHGIIHRDLKASNIMLNADGRPKIMDFGLAKFAQGSMLTQSGSTVGTAAYMSPEQAKGEETDYRTDIYSIGVVFFQMLTGSLPFPHAHHLAILYAVVNESPKPPRELDPSIPPVIEQIILKAMAKKPEERFQSSSEMARSLLEVDGNITSVNSLRSRFQHLLHAAGASSTEVRESKTAHRTRKSRFVQYVLISVAFLVLAYVAVMMFPSHVGDQGEARRLAKVHKDRAMVLIKDNNADLAAHELELAIGNDSTYAPAWSTLATLSLARNEKDLAVEQARKAAQFDKNDGNILYNLAFILEEAGKENEALVWYKEAIEKDPGFLEAYCALANLYVKAGDAGSAVELLLKSDRLHPSSPRRFQLFRTLGKAHLALRRPEKAREDLEQSLTLKSNEPETVFLLASVLDSLGLQNESLTRWKEYASIEKDPAKQAGALSRIEQLKKKQH